ncbi:MAG: sigma-54 dependent transcriptional regulator [Thermodesulfobacteriota bacterium]|nr:sigma-54 dependent transcriptional regulator [Thermodesulfobacteriota bacterium]
MKSRILIIDDEELIRWSLRNSLEKAGYEVVDAESGEMALDILGNEEFNLVILDMVLPGEDGLNILKQIRKADMETQVIMITAFGSIETAVEAIRYGAYDYMTKPFDLGEVLLKVERALQNAGVVKELGQFRKIQEDRFSKETVIFKSRAMTEIIGKIERICEADVDMVLLTGETGTGKGLLARHIHKTGSSSRGPFVTLNCTSIPDNLLESELFGYEKGAFTDAKSKKDGVVEQARGGTLFLDEIGDMPYRLQGKLLRFIEEKKIRRLGGRKEINVNLKLIAATNRDLGKAMQAGEFRSDLYHRLNLINIHIPPLRERIDGIAHLSEFFLKKFNLKYGGRAEGFTGEAYEMLMDYPWPGNVRELSNVVERAIILENARFIDRSQLIGYLVKSPILSHNQVRQSDLYNKGVSFEKLMSDFKKNIFQMALEECNHNKARAAKLLKMDRSTFRYQMKMVNLE